jgi:UDP-N-acetyl-D-galactosamine dehydrogenase
MTSGKNFRLGYSPERINPGDNIHRLDNTQKIVSGDTPITTQKIREIYSKIAPICEEDATIEEAESAKVLENSQRDINIAFMNEAAIIFELLRNKLNYKINTNKVIKLMNTKWNALKFEPGLVGGHCIGVDPYYMAYKSHGLGYFPNVITAGRCVNDSMGKYIAEQIVKRINGDKILIMGVTFKENVEDSRNSKVFDIVYELEKYGKKITITDPIADPDKIYYEYKHTIKNSFENEQYDCVVVAVKHKQYLELTEKYFALLTNFIVDIKGIYDFKNIKIWQP